MRVLYSVLAKANGRSVDPKNRSSKAIRQANMRYQEEKAADMEEVISFQF